MTHLITLIVRWPRGARPSKDAAQMGVSPFEARGVYDRAGHFGPDPLARSSG